MVSDLWLQTTDLWFQAHPVSDLAHSQDLKAALRFFFHLFIFPPQNSLRTCPDQLVIILALGWAFLVLESPQCYAEIVAASSSVRSFLGLYQILKGGYGLKRILNCCRWSEDCVQTQPGPHPLPPPPLPTSGHTHTPCPCLSSFTT